MAIINFDASKVEPMKPQETIPAGWYDLQITKSEIKPTKDATGAFLEIEMEVIGGEYAKRKLYDRFNLQNSNPAAVEIAYKQLSAVCHAVGVIQCQDSSQLHARPFSGKVKLIPAGPGNDGKMYDAKNEMGGYKVLQNNGSGGQVAAPTWAAQPAQPTAPAWVAQPTPAAPPATPWQQQPQGTPAAAPWQQSAPPVQAQPTAPAPQQSAPWQQQPTAPAAAPTPSWAQAPAAGGTPPWAARS